MKKLLVPLAISASIFLITPTFAASGSELYNPASRTDTTYVTGSNAPAQAGANYAYWHHRHWHRWNHWHHRWHRHYYW